MALPSGRAGVQRTLSIMAELTRSRAGRTSTMVRHTALCVVAELPPKDYGAEVTALQHFVRDGIRYARDVRGVETLQTPERTLVSRAGDCDDKSMLLAAMLESVGHKTRFEAIALEPGRFSHVFPSVRLGDKWVALETIVPGAEPGWRPRGVVDTITKEV